MSVCWWVLKGRRWIIKHSPELSHNQLQLLLEMEAWQANCIMMKHSETCHMLLPARAWGRDQSIIRSSTETWTCRIHCSGLKPHLQGTNHRGAFRLPPSLQEEGFGPQFADSFTVFFFLIFKIKFIYFNWRIITLQYCDGFCHTLTWIGHRDTYVPPFWTPFLPYPSRWSRALALSVSCIELALVIYFTYVNGHISNYSLETSHACPLPLSPKVYSLCLCLLCCPNVFRLLFFIWI